MTRGEWQRGGSAKNIVDQNLIQFRNSRIWIVSPERLFDTVLELIQDLLKLILITNLGGMIVLMNHALVINFSNFSDQLCLSDSKASNKMIEKTSNQTRKHIICKT